MPTENRSSNTETVSVPRALIEQAMQACFDAGYGIPHDELRNLLAQPADQHQGEPLHQIEYLGDGGGGWTDVDRAEYEGRGAQPDFRRRVVYTHADAGEVERLRDALMDIARKASESRSVTRRLTWIEGRAQSALEGKAWAKHVFQMPDPLNSAPKAERLRAELANLRKLHDSACAQLAERDALLGSAKSALCHLLHNIKTSGKRIDLGLAKDSADTVITLINALQAGAKS